MGFVDGLFGGGLVWYGVGAWLRYGGRRAGCLLGRVWRRAWSLVACCLTGGTRSNSEQGGYRRFQVVFVKVGYCFGVALGNRLDYLASRVRLWWDVVFGLWMMDGAGQRRGKKLRDASRSLCSGRKRHHFKPTARATGGPRQRTTGSVTTNSGGREGAQTALT